MTQSLEKLLRAIEPIDCKGNTRIAVTDICDNSKLIKDGSLFVAIKGLHVDSHKYIPDAITRGAKAIVCEVFPVDLTKYTNVVFVKVKDTRQSLALLAAAWYDNPAQKLKIIGVTGTDGKTTTSNIIYWIMKEAGLKVGLISTVSAQVDNKEYDTGFHVTNPEPLQLHRFLSQMHKEGCEYAVLEVTSHGLDQERVCGINFEMGVLTNITHEHLDYHKTLANYRAAKAKLFNNSQLVLLNKDDLSLVKFRKLIKGDTRIVEYSKNDVPLQIKRAVDKRFIENFNKYNASAAIKVAQLLGINDKTIVSALSTFPGVIGRMEEIRNKKGIRIIVDFAHTPNALFNVLSSLKGQVGKTNRLIVVFGCAGERDVRKRPLMGRIAAEHADVSIFTAEDPRNEKVKDIIDQMEKGARRVHHKSEYHKILERGAAIHYAISNVAKRGDTVVICGKGHEKSMAYNSEEYEWSDHLAVKKALQDSILKPKRLYL